MEPEAILPKRLVNYIHDVGVRSLDHLAENFKPGDHQPDAVNTLVDHWKSMSPEDKQKFVDRVAASVIEVVAASAILPIGLKLGKKAAKSARKAIKRRSKALRKNAKKILRTHRRAAKAKKTKPKKKTKAA